MTIHYHGGPIWGDKKISYHELMPALWRGGGALISYAHPGQLKYVVNIDCSLILDNGAFTWWRRDKENQLGMNWTAHWDKFYDSFVAPWYSRIDWFIIPDVIEGTEDENDMLIARVPKWLRGKSVPVWHSDESIERLIRLCKSHSRVAIGCCGAHRSIRSKAWKMRMDEVFHEVYIENCLNTKLHGLRMLDARAMSLYPFDSVDSSSVATNVPKTEKVIPQVPCKLARTAILRAAKELVKPPTINEWLMRKIFDPKYR